MADIPITPGSGGSSVATELVGARNFQQIEVVGQGGASILGINPDRSINVSIIGIPNVGVAGGSVGLLGGTAFIGNVGIASGSVLALASGNQSVSGTVGASIIGAVPVNIQSSVAVTIISGSIAASFTPPANQSVSGTVAANIQGSVATVIIGGSIAASFTPPANQSVSGTIQTDVRGSVAVAIISGSIAATFTPPANQSVSGTVQTDVRGSVAVAIISGSIAATFTPPANQSVSGTVGASIIGQLPAGTAPLGSVTALQGTNPWVGINVGSIITTNIGSIITILQSSSIIAINAGSVIAVPSGSVITVLQSPSIVGTYAEDAPSASGDKGFLVMGARNDTLASVTSNDGDYSSHVVGPAGELIAANAPFTKWVQGTTSIVSGGSVALIAAQGSSIFTYLTSLQIANTTATNALVTFQGASSSIIGYAPAPANGGAVFTIPNAWKSNANGAITASISAAASVFLSGSGFISKT